MSKDEPFSTAWTPPGPGSLVYDEASALFVGLIWRLTWRRAIYAVPRYWREAGFYAAGEPYALIRWEYEVEDSAEGEIGALRGFVPARSCVRLSPPPGPWEREHADFAGFFETPVFSMLREVFRGLLGDATAAMNVYAFDRGNVERAVAALSSEQQPELRDVLNEGDLMIHLGVGIDWPANVIVVHTLSAIDSQLEALREEYQASMERFEASVPEITSHAEWEERVEEMLGLGDDGQLSRPRR